MSDLAALRRAALAELSPSRVLRLCDVGASPLSEPPYHALMQDGLAHVFGFEPNQDQFDRLQSAKSDHETYFCQAVGLPGDRTLYMHRRPGFTSLYAFDRPALEVLGKTKWMVPPANPVPIQPMTLDMTEGLPSIDVLKMDLQGGELEVLRGGIGKLAQAVAVITEVRFHRIYQDEPLFGDLDAELRAQGFKLHKFLFTKSVMLPHAHEEAVVRPRMTSQLLDGDAVYIRENPLSDLSDDQLAFLAQSADAIFDSPDLALGCLDELIARDQAPADLPDRYISALRSNQRAKVPAS